MVDVSYWTFEAVPVIRQTSGGEVFEPFFFVVVLEYSSAAESRQDFQACWAFLNIYCISSYGFFVC